MPLMMMIGNKADLSANREVTYEEACKYAEKIGALYIETSAKTAQNIVESFCIASSKIVAKIQNKEIDISDPVYQL